MARGPVRRLARSTAPMGVFKSRPAARFIPEPSSWDSTWLRGFMSSTPMWLSRARRGDLMAQNVVTVIGEARRGAAGP
jgi:hypothetical protein